MHLKPMSTSTFTAATRRVDRMSRRVAAVLDVNLVLFVCILHQCTGDDERDDGPMTNMDTHEYALVVSLE